MERALGRVDGVDAGSEQRQLVGEVQPHPTVVAADGTRADPHDLTGCAQFVEVGLPVALHP